MKTIAFYNVKGGGGKSTSAATIAHMMAAKHGKKVLLIDLDPQGCVTDLFLGETWFSNWTISDIEDMFAGKSFCEFSVESLFVDPDMDIHKCIHKTEYEGLDVIPAFLTLAEVEERVKANIRVPQQFCLKNHIEAVRDEYDFCVLDCSPSVSLVNINGLAMTDKVYVPMNCDKWSLMGIIAAQRLMNTVRRYNPTLELGGCFFTFWRARKINDEAEQLLREYLGDRLIPITIGSNQIALGSTYAHKPILAMDTGSRKSRVTSQYLALTDYIVNHS